jgi:putative hydrolase of the HAD superfamily
MIKNILFNYGNVLAYPKTGNWFIPPNARKILGVGNCLSVLFHFNKIGSSFYYAHKYLDDNHLLHTEEEELSQFTEFYSQILKELGINKNRDKIAGLLAADTVCNDDKVIFYEDVTDVLREIKASFHIGVLSDTWPSLKRIFDAKGITPLLDGLIMSCDYGICKDNIQLFHVAESELNLDPGATAFIDDSQANLDNSVKAGFIPILMDRKGKVKQSRYPVVHDLNEAYRFIRKYNEEHPA